MFPDAKALRAEALQKVTQEHLDECRERVMRDLGFSAKAGAFKTSVSFYADWWTRRNVEIVARELRASGYSTKMRRAFFTEPPFRIKLWVSWQEEAPTKEPFPRPVRFDGEANGG